MQEKFMIDKMSLVVTTRCNLKCRLCDEFIPMNKPFPDMACNEAGKILDALFDVVDHVGLMHLSGGGEPFLNPHLADLIDVVFEYGQRFDNLMVFTNSTIPISDKLLDVLQRHRERVVVHASNYGIAQKNSTSLYKKLKENGINLRVIKYFGEDQDYGGWVDFGDWQSRQRTDEENSSVFKNCGITRIMNGNWRTRDGTVHWCQRCQRGMELGILEDFPEDYVNLFGSESIDEKRNKFRAIMSKQFLKACDHCSGDHGTDDSVKRFPAGEQMKQEGVSND
jgi:organic radical activating enzyme